MTTIKSFSDLQQSKKLAEILPLESGDMCYVWDYERKCYTPEFFSFIQNQDNEGVEHIDYPCWSLAALLKLLPKSARLEKGNVTELYRVTLPVELETSDWYDNPIDACVAMIEKLYERKML